MMTMSLSQLRKYVKSCFLLTLPVMAWDFFLADKLPLTFQSAIFWHDVPLFLAMGEHIFRILIFAFTLAMPLSFASKRSQIGLVIYLIGIVLYFLSWLALIYGPLSMWSNSYFGFLAPAYTPVLWLIGISFIGTRFYFNFPYKRRVFLAISILFLLFHNLHTLMVYNRFH
jgi:hypothetical protein